MISLIIIRDVITCIVRILIFIDTISSLLQEAIFL